LAVRSACDTPQNDGTSAVLTTVEAGVIVAEGASWAV
jgi:hypothetical protein